MTTTIRVKFLSSATEKTVQLRPLTRMFVALASVVVRHNIVFTSALVPTAGRVESGFAYAKPVTKTASGAKPMLYGDPFIYLIQLSIRSPVILS